MGGAVSQQAQTGMRFIARLHDAHPLFHLEVAPLSLSPNTSARSTMRRAFVS